MIVAILSFIIFAWFLTGYLGMSRNTRLGIVFAMFLSILLSLLVLAETNSFSIRMGGWAPWATISFLVGLVFLFQLFIKILKNKSKDHKSKDNEKNDEFSEHELERYSRHIILKEIGGLGQRRIKDSSVLILGVGGLGSPVIQYLAASGVGTIGIIDDDKVSLSNLQRQVIYPTEQLGEQKVFSAMEAIHKLNSNVMYGPIIGALMQK